MMRWRTCGRGRQIIALCWMRTLSDSGSLAARFCAIGGAVSSSVSLDPKRTAGFPINGQYENRQCSAIWIDLMDSMAVIGRLLPTERTRQLAAPDVFQPVE